ncbi:Ctr copper transporter family protein [Purpureocillium lilacinum]|uniref:Ctr copper transporter family protein n=1 Tax=Purpureocillium lilacinum TaxID=33203 RepID=A0A2U3EE73_PURLI|nr:Ctr copper transporter family protein [Purpureocillium lilacinum]
MNLVGFVTPGASARGFFEPQFIHSCASCRASSHDSPRRPGPPSSVSNSGITTTTVPLAAHWPWPSRRGGMHARNQLLCECYGVNTGHWLAARPPLQKGTVTTNKIRRSIERGRGGTISIFAESSHLPALLRGKLAQTPSRVTRPRLLRPNERTNERTGRGYPSVSSDVLHAIAGPTGTPATCERHKSPKGSGPVSAFARARAQGRKKLGLPSRVRLSSVSSSLGHIRVLFLVAGFRHSPSLPPPSHRTRTHRRSSPPPFPRYTNENNSPVFLVKHRAARRPPREERQYQTRARSNGPRDHDGNHGLHVPHHVHGHARHHLGCPRGPRHGRHGHGRRQQLQDLRKMTEPIVRDMTGSFADGKPPLQMLFNFYTVDACFLSSQWHVTSRGMFAGSCIGVFLLAMSLEFLRRSVKEFDRFLVRQHIAKHQGAGTDRGSVSSKDAAAPIAAPAGGVCPAVVPPFRPNVFQQAIRAFLHFLQFTVAYFLMLLAMYFNIYIIVSIILGAFFGAFIFQWETLPLVPALHKRPPFAVADEQREDVSTCQEENC